ncbi:hypothetical protein ETB91_11690 [Lacticaseibacillus rhamnosus]|uniref:hypothetical protein n=1 Tax=Lacticaseibacillus rhamnosus TaxID=47715 RepID=UPI001013C366|nr:hypothetical protein [Lacticaseibacillus rhamnosus]RXS53335.1 hypothetical protein ETB91_11690 [Lacticaseibacillus rhamnosus]
MTNETSVNAQIVLSEGLELGPNVNVPKIVGPTLVLAMPLKETALSFNVSVLTHGLDYSIRHSVKLEVLEGDKAIANIENGLSSLQNFLGGFVFNFGIRNAVFKSVGVHIIRFYLDGKLLKEQKFWTVYVGSAE